MKILIEDTGEPLVDLRDLGRIAFSPKGEMPGNLQYTKVRFGVFERMVAAQNLLPEGLRLLLTEGYRSLEDQEHYFAQRYEQIRSLYPSWTHAQIFLESTKMVAPVINLDGTTNIPPHSTGGAIDICLIDGAGKLVDMGIHPYDWPNDLDNSISRSDSNLVSHDAKTYRRIMSDALLQVGFVNYPLEYWHWSYGERDWAEATKSTNTIYGSLAKKLI